MRGVVVGRVRHLGTTRLVCRPEGHPDECRHVLEEFVVQVREETVKGAAFVPRLKDLVDWDSEGHTLTLTTHDDKVSRKIKVDGEVVYPGSVKRAGP